MDSAALIREARTSAGLSQRELAERADTSPAAISLYENSERIPRVDTLVRIIDATGAELRIAIEFDGARRSSKRDAEPIDVEANGRDLLAALELAHHIPATFDDELQYPVFADLAR